MVRSTMGVAALCALSLPVEGMQQPTFQPPDSLDPVELVARWEADMSVPTTGPPYSRWSAGLIAALVDFRTDPDRAAAVRDELEKVALRSTIPDVQRGAVIRIVAGHTVMSAARSDELPDTRPIARQLERIYHSSTSRFVRRGALSSVRVLAGSGRAYALTWLEPLITLPPEEQTFSGEAKEAMSTAASLDRAGQALVVRLRDEGLIRDPDARFWAGFITVGG